VQQRASTKLRLLDQLVGAGEQHWRHGKAERLGRLQVYHQLELEWGRVAAFESDQLCA
jgi:hypothetical protein